MLDVFSKRYITSKLVNSNLYCYLSTNNIPSYIKKIHHRLKNKNDIKISKINLKEL